MAILVVSNNDKIMVWTKKAKSWYFSGSIFSNCIWSLTKKIFFTSTINSMINKRIWWQLLRLRFRLGTTKNGKGWHQKVYFFFWYAFMIMLQYLLKFFYWKHSQIFQARCQLSIWTYWNKFVLFFFQVMTLCTMNTSNVTLES